MLSPDAGASPAAPATEAASTMLGKQLDVLDTRALVWNGDVWPGQRATIALREDLEGDAANDADVDAVGPSWRMRIALELPSLGRVQASIVLRDGGVDFVVAAANESAQARLDAAKAVLAEALTRTDVAFARIAVERGPDR